MSCKDIEPKCHPSPARYISPFWGFTEFTPTIPKLYWNVKSQEQRILRICDMLDRIICYSDYLGDKVDLNKADIEWLKEQFEKFKNGEFDEFYLEQISKWVDEHMQDIIEQAVKWVYFGLNDEGYFVAYIPESWNDITFDTGAVYGRSDYGRLILRFEADGAIDNTYSYSLSQPTRTQQLIADLEINAHRTDAAFDTLFTNLDEEVTLNANI